MRTPLLSAARLGCHSPTGSSLRVTFASLAQPSARVSNRVACFRAGGKQFPVTLGDDLDRTVGHFDSGLIVDRVRRDWDFGGPLFYVGHGGVLEALAIQL